MRTHSSSLEPFAASPAGSWFETREDALLTMRVQDLILRSIAKRCVAKDEAMNWKLFWIRSLYSSEQQQNHQDDDDEAETAAAIISRAVEWPAADAAEAAKQRDNKDNKNDCSYRHVAISSSPAVGTRCSAFGPENKWELEKFHRFPALVRSSFSRTIRDYMQ